MLSNIKKIAFNGYFFLNLHLRLGKEISHFYSLSCHKASEGIVQFRVQNAILCQDANNE